MNAQYWRSERTRMQKIANDYDPIRSHPDLTAIELKIETVGRQMKPTHRGDPEYLQHDQHIRSLSDQWRTRYQELNDAHAQVHAPQAAAVPGIPKPGMSRGKMGLIGAGVGLAGLGAGALWHHHQQEKVAALTFFEKLQLRHNPDYAASVAPEEPREPLSGKALEEHLKLLDQRVLEAKAAEAKKKPKTPIPPAAGAAPTAQVPPPASAPHQPEMPRLGASEAPHLPKPGMGRGLKMGLVGMGVGAGVAGLTALHQHHQQEKIAALNFEEFPGHPRQKELEKSYRQWQGATAQAGRLTPEHPDYAAASAHLDELSRQHENLYRDVQNDWLHGHFPNDEPNPQTPPWAKRGIKGRLGVLAGGLGLAGAGAAWAAHQHRDK